MSTGTSRSLGGNGPTSLELAQKLLSHFRGRSDYVAVPNGVGFKPEALAAPLTAERFMTQHLGGQGCLGFYLLQPDGKVWCCAIDFDNKKKNPDPEWKSKAERVYGYLQSLGLTIKRFTGVERSEHARNCVLTKPGAAADRLWAFHRMREAAAWSAGCGDYVCEANGRPKSGAALFWKWGEPRPRALSGRDLYLSRAAHPRRRV